jgi:hypothetical protein
MIKYEFDYENFLSIAYIRISLSQIKSAAPACIALISTLMLFYVFSAKAQNINPDIVTGQWNQPNIAFFDFNLNSISSKLTISSQSQQLEQINNFQKATSCPVAISTGEKHLPEVDYVGPGEFPLMLSRTFSS